MESAGVDVVNTQVRRETAAFDGIQGIDLAGSPGPGVMSTSFATTPSQTYMLTFHYSRNNGLGANPARAKVEVSGASVLLQGEVRHAAPSQAVNAYLAYSGNFIADGILGPAKRH